MSRLHWREHPTSGRSACGVAWDPARLREDPAVVTCLTCLARIEEAFGSVDLSMLTAREKTEVRDRAGGMATTSLRHRHQDEYQELRVSAMAEVEAEIRSRTVCAGCGERVGPEGPYQAGVPWSRSHPGEAFPASGLCWSCDEAPDSLVLDLPRRPTG